MNSITWLMFILAIMGGSIIGVSVERCVQDEFDFMWIYGAFMLVIAMCVCAEQ